MRDIMILPGTMVFAMRCPFRCPYCKTALLYNWR
jgi:pyruvate-formate lyase-activating enzyme